MKICLIGNSGIKHNLKDGQTTKFRLYKKKIEDEGVEVFLVDLECFFHHPLSIFQKIRKGIKQSDRIVLISGERACRLLMPYINSINKKYRKPFILPVVGSGVLHSSIDHLDERQIYNFFVNKDFSLAKKKKRIQEQLAKIDCILLETTLSKDVYQAFYGINNCKVLNNFRDIVPKINIKENSGSLKMVYLSRVMAKKGIFDLLDSLSSFDDNYQLDIYGTIYFSDDEELKFNSYLNDKIKYKGVIDNENVIRTLNDYDLLVFPTRFSSEGTPGVISESLMAGTPVLSSNFPQASCLLKNGFDSLLYEMFDKEDLKEKIVWAIIHTDKIRAMKYNALESGKSFSYEYNKKVFFDLILNTPKI